MQNRLRIWQEILHPAWRWVVLIPFAAISVLATARDELIEAQHPELYKLSRWLPGWSWQVYLLIGATLAIALILEGTYRAVKRRDDLLTGIFAPEKAISHLVDLRDEGRRLYNDTSHPPETYNKALEDWESRVADFILQHYSSSELHAFRSATFFNGGEYTLSGISNEWREATKNQRVILTARIVALDRTIQSGSLKFFGPRQKAAEWLEKHR
jgi:hypothetical protein